MSWKALHFPLSLSQTSFNLFMVLEAVQFETEFFSALSLHEGTDVDNSVLLPSHELTLRNFLAFTRQSDSGNSGHDTNRIDMKSKGGLVFFE